MPKRILKNSDLEKMVDTTDEWITTRTGMKERRIAEKDELTSDMGAVAAKRAIQRANIDLSEIDFILVATLSPDYIFPSTACAIQYQLGIKDIAAMDVQAACSGMIYALSLAKSYIVSGMYKNILVVASEKVSAFIDYQDRNTCVLFGDGASACIVSSKKRGVKIGEFELGADGEHQKLLFLPAGGVKNPLGTHTIAEKEHFLRMDGREVFRHAVRRMEVCAQKCLTKASWKTSEVAYFIPHQANIRIMESVAKRLSIEERQVVNIIAHTGNTCAASVGICLDVLMESKGLKKDDKLLFIVFGAGFTWGAMTATVEEDHD